MLYRCAGRCPGDCRRGEIRTGASSRSTSSGLLSHHHACDGCARRPMQRAAAHRQSRIGLRQRPSRPRAFRQHNLSGVIRCLLQTARRSFAASKPPRVSPFPSCSGSKSRTTRCANASHRAPPIHTCLDATRSEDFSGAARFQSWVRAALTSARPRPMMTRFSCSGDAS
jgi:hypothetical protein